jgi:hypothetical protein
MISKSELKQIIKEMLISEQLLDWGKKPGAPTEDLPADTYAGVIPALEAFTDEHQYVGQGEAQYSPPPAANAMPRAKQTLHDLPDTASMTEDEYNLLYGPGAAQKKQIADIEGGGTGWKKGHEPEDPKDPWYDKMNVPEDQRPPFDKKEEEKKDDKKKQPKKKKKKKREDAEAEEAAAAAAKDKLAKMAAEQELSAAQAQSLAMALETAQTLFGAMRGWGTDEDAINIALTNSMDGEGLPAVYDAYDQILQQAVRMGIADADDGDLVQWLQDDGMDEWAMRVGTANQEQRRALGAMAQERAVKGVGGAALAKAAELKERSIYSSYPDQHKLFENWNKFVKSTKE